MPSPLPPHRLSLALLAAAALLSVPTTRADFVTGTFEDQDPGPDTSRNDFRPADAFTTAGFTLNNVYNPTYDVWSGFSVSSRLDNTFGGLDYTHEYGAYAPAHSGLTGSGGSATYAVAYNGSTGDALINLAPHLSPYSIDLTNTTYDAQSITQGDAFARAFHQGDYFRLDILGYSGPDATGTLLGSVPFDLADFRGSSLQLVHDWTTVNLTSLAGSQSLAFTLTSTDVGSLGMNTPAFFALDNLTALRTTPEPSALALLALGLAGLALRQRRSRTSRTT